MRRKLNGINEYFKRKSLFGYLMHNTFNTLAFIFVATFLFLFIFKPYALGDFDLKPQLILIVGYSIIATIAYAVSFAIFSPHNRTIWTKQLELGLFALCFFITWLLTWGYSVINIEFFFKEVYNIHEIPPLPGNLGLTLLFYVVAIGIILYLVIHSFDILITHERLGKQEKAVDIQKMTDQKVCLSQNTIKLTGANGKDPLEIELHQFIAAEAKGHYIQVTYNCCDERIKKHLLRTSMKKIELQLEDADRFFRCHKSYIINLEHINNAYTITSKNKSFVALNFYPKPIPVSRPKIEFLKNELEKVEEEEDDFDEI
jgi:hypothetical protein